KFVLKFVAGTASVDVVERLVGEVGLGLFIEGTHVGVRGGTVEVKVGILDILSVVALVAGQAIDALLEDGVLAIPEGQGEAEATFTVGDAEKAVFPPAIGAAAGVVVGEVFPTGSIRGVVLADRAPLAFGEV